MISEVVGWGVSTVKLGTALAGGVITCETGVGCVVALLAALGMAWSAALCVVDACFLVTALVYYSQDGGFKAKDVGLLGWE